MLDDVVRHGLHDLYWCYRFERSVSAYKSVKTNRKHSEVTLSKYECRLAFLTVREKVQTDDDNLYPPQRTLLEVHNQLLTTQRRPGFGRGTILIHHLRRLSHYILIYSFHMKSINFKSR
jgi:hypothetical protein